MPGADVVRGLGVGSWVNGRLNYMQTSGWHARIVRAWSECFSECCEDVKHLLELALVFSLRGGGGGGGDHPCIWVVRCSGVLKDSSMPR